MAGAYRVRILPPWFENLGKRQVKAPKISIRDTGLLPTLLGIRSHDDVLGHPQLGASREGLVIEQRLAALRTRDAYYWATHGGAELDLITVRNGKRYGVEVRYADAHGTTKSRHTALADNITVVPAGEIPALITALKSGTVLRA